MKNKLLILNQFAEVKDKDLVQINGGKKTSKGIDLKKFFDGLRQTLR